MTGELSASARRVQNALDACGVRCRVVEMPDSTRTARDAADAIGCRVEQIVKSLVFLRRDTGKPLLVVASGGNRVDEGKLAEAAGGPVGKADADFVRERLGFAIGGVPPIGHLERLPTFVDEDLLMFEEIWAAAGTPHAVFRLTPADLVRLTEGRAVDLAERR